MSECSRLVSCDKCHDKHVTVMHYDKHKSFENKGRKAEEKTSLCTAVCGDPQISQCCTKILLVELTLDGSDKILTCYAIIDEQSTSSFAHPNVAEYFNVAGTTVDYSLKTLSESESFNRGKLLKGFRIRGINEKKKINLPPLYSNELVSCSKDAIATPNIVRAHPQIRHLSKHFIEIDESADVMLLIGRDAGECMKTKCYGNKPPFAHHTALGWALVGSSCIQSEQARSKMNVLKTHLNEHFSCSQTFPQRAKEQWSLPNLDIFEERRDDELPDLSKNDKRFLQLVTSEIHTNENGNIVLPLPFKDSDPSLPDNRHQVYYRTKNTLNRLTKDTVKLGQCITVMQKYLDAGHVEAVPDDEFEPKRNGKAYWLPIFPVTHPKKGKVRLVFDSSATFSKTSLNDQLIPGPDVNNKLKDVLVGFRNGTIGFSADIESMFHNFYLKQDERDFARFYWFKNNDATQDICQYRAKVHIFGNTSSPALANLAIRFAAADLPQDMNYVRQFIDEQFYVDDGLSSANSVEDAIRTLKDTAAVLGRYNIRLHKFCSSSKSVLNAFSPSEIATDKPVVNFEENSIHSALGLAWNTSSDSIIIQSNVPNRPFTLRGVLATINSVFDPLGISAPIVLEGKIMQRKFLTTGDTSEKDWDKELPIEYEEQWNTWKNSLSDLSGLSIARGYHPHEFGPVIRKEIHAFCDASIESTGYVIYLRSENETGKHHVSFIIGNSKIAPRSNLSVPRLELCSALDVSLAAHEMSDKLCIPNDQVYLYSDSMITLGYLNNQTKKFTRYVSRRVDLTLKSFPASQWHYVPTEDNPADLATRKQTIHSLKASNWISGPSFLLNESYVPSNHAEEIDLPETLPTARVLHVSASSSCNFVTSSSSYNKSIKVFSFILNSVRKLIDRTRQRLGTSLAPRGPASPIECRNLLISIVQKESFPELFQANADKVSHKLTSLSPFKDPDGLIRVGGRLRFSNLEYSNKFPILISGNHHFAKLVIAHFHEKVKHQGRVITLSAIREAGYFILHGSSVIKKFVNKCVLCRRLRLPLNEQKMSDLPSDRLDVGAPPFLNTGMDVFGPYAVTDGANTRRSTSTKKCWAVLFTCMNSRATHIESLPYLDGCSMINALRRFFCIRGPCKKLRSDQGTNFVAAKNQDTSFSASVMNEITSQGCEWEMNPPKASHFGGIWERQIKSIKSILNTCFLQMGSRVLTRDDLNTFLQECACILNNTPLWEYSNDPNDPRPLTPAMLLNLRSDPPSSVNVYTERDFLAYGSKRWRRIQFLSDQFWSRWKVDYLQSLQRRNKWHSEKRSLKVGDIVLLKDSSKRYQWPIAKVLSVKKSKDGLVRSADVVTSSRNSNGTKLFSRPISELSLLVPVDS